MITSRTTRIQGWVTRFIVGLAIVWGGFVYAVDADPNLIGAPSEQLRPHVREEVLVVLKGKNATIAAGAIEGRIMNRYNAGNRTILRVKLPAGMAVEKAMAENWASRDARILRVEPNYQVFAVGIPNDTHFNYLWGLYNSGQTGGTANSDIQAADAWDITTGSYDVVVAVIDSGVSSSHPDLANQMWTNTDEIAGNGIDDDHNGYVDDRQGWDFDRNSNNPIDENGHGTHCAGTIAAEGNNGMGVAGVAWQCRIMPCRFLDSTGSGSVADAIAAINYAVANGADILSNSWGGGGYSQALKAAIENARDHNVLFVAAAGNSANDNDLTAFYPANYAVANLISVAATDDEDNLANFSCYGRNTVHVAAPGVNILSTVPGGYTWMSGTSMATPHVAGAAALLLAANPQMSVAELKTRLTWCGDIMPALQNKVISGRRLNIYNALTAQDGITVVEPAEGAHWVTGFDHTIQWISIGGGNVVSIYLQKAGQIIDTIAENVQNSGLCNWTAPVELENGSDYSIVVTDGLTEGQSGQITIDDLRTNYYTEWFNDRACDLVNKSIIFAPDGAGGYVALAHQITALPTPVTGSTLLTMRDDDSRCVTLARPVSFYGDTYTRLYVGSNGYITFDEADTEYRSTPASHFALRRISVFFQDLNPVLRGKVLYKELADRVVVTWNNVAQYSSLTATSTFQAELYQDGKIRLSWMKLACADAIVGFSQGNGIAADYSDEDLSTCDSYVPTVTSITLGGPRSLAEDAAAALTCTSRHAYGVVRTADNTQVQWSTDDPAATIDVNGVLSYGDINFFKHINVAGELEGKTAALGLCVKDTQTGTIGIQNYALTRGTVAGYKSLVLTGTTSVDAATLLGANTVVVKLWNRQNTCVYSCTFDKVRRFYLNNVYSRTITVGIQRQTLRLEPLRSSFSLGVVNVNLAGATAPSYFTIESGSYKGLGIIN